MGRSSTSMNTTDLMIFRPLHILVRLLTVGLLVLVLTGCKKAIKWDSTHLDQSLTIDGNLDDWGAEVQALNQKGLRVAIANDDAYLYLGLSTDDPAVQRQVITRGLIVWLDAGGGKKKTFGVQYPIGLVNMIGQGGFGGRGGQPPSEEERHRRLEESLVSLQIHDEQDDPLHLSVADFVGGELGFARSFGSVGYELRIPLQATDVQPYAVGAAPGTVIGIGIEVPELDRETLREQFSGMGGQGGRAGDGMGGLGGDRRGPAGGGFGDGQGGLGGGMGGPRGALQQETLRLWAKVTLAED